MLPEMAVTPMQPTATSEKQAVEESSGMYQALSRPRIALSDNSCAALETTLSEGALQAQIPDDIQVDAVALVYETNETDAIAMEIEKAEGDSAAKSPVPPVLETDNEPLAPDSTVDETSDEPPGMFKKHYYAKCLPLTSCVHSAIVQETAREAHSADAVQAAAIEAEFGTRDSSTVEMDAAEGISGTNTPDLPLIESHTAPSPRISACGDQTADVASGMYGKSVLSSFTKVR